MRQRKKDKNIWGKGSNIVLYPPPFFSSSMILRRKLKHNYYIIIIIIISNNKDCLTYSIYKISLFEVIET